MALVGCRGRCQNGVSLYEDGKKVENIGWDPAEKESLVQFEIELNKENCYELERVGASRG